MHQPPDARLSTQGKNTSLEVSEQHNRHTRGRRYKDLCKSGREGLRDGGSVYGGGEDWLECDSPFTCLFRHMARRPELCGAVDPPVAVRHKLPAREVRTLMQWSERSAVGSYQIGRVSRGLLGRGWRLARGVSASAHSVDRGVRVPFHGTACTSDAQHPFPQGVCP